MTQADKPSFNTMDFRMIRITDLSSHLTYDIRIGQDIRFLIKIRYLKYLKSDLLKITPIWIVLRSWLFKNAIVRAIISTRIWKNGGSELSDFALNLMYIVFIPEHFLCQMHLNNVVWFLAVIDRAFNYGHKGHLRRPKSGNMNRAAIWTVHGV